MMNTDLHPAQVSILSSLRHTDAARYSSLQQPTSMDSDVFKFHIRKLVKFELVYKTPQGTYSLTETGMQFANMLDENKRTISKRPKVSVLLVVIDKSNSEPQYLFQQRKRQPHWDYWGFMSGRVLWGESITAAAKHELMKQTGLTATFRTQGFIRQRDYHGQTKHVLEDNLFQVTVAEVSTHKLLEEYLHGFNKWMAIRELQKQENVFETTQAVLDLIDSDESFMELDVHREPADSSSQSLYI